MARWRVGQGNQQFTAEDLAELQRFARQGKLGPGDLIQPPGASDWLYATELPELNSHLKQAPPGFDVDHRPRKGGNGVIIALLLLGIAGAGYGIYHTASMIPKADELELLGDRLKLSEMLVTADPSAQVLSQPTDGASASGTAAKDSKVQLMAKRGPWYRIQTADAVDGWVKVDEVIPAYLFADAETRQDYDPIYNPDRYVSVKNASWMQLPDQQRNNVTVFQFMLTNASKFTMTDVKLLVTVRDNKGTVLETREIGIEGIVAPARTRWSARSRPTRRTRRTCRACTPTRPSWRCRRRTRTWPCAGRRASRSPWESKDFEKANVDLLEVRAIPKEIEKKEK
ncbi:MAG: DUF4339 domain-containing protein [Planctomycetes bacterium]|nr:DUF4339 domain-containing protein [Planctomycetota bacterium]